MGISTEELERRSTRHYLPDYVQRMAHPVPLPDRVFTPGVSDSYDEELSPSTRMLLAMSRIGKPMYLGTVPAATVERRRAKNRAARRARRVSRR